MRTRTKALLGGAFLLTFGIGMVMDHAVTSDHVVVAQAPTPTVVVPSSPAMGVPPYTAPVAPVPTEATTTDPTPEITDTTDGPAPDDGGAPPQFKHPLPAFPVKQDYCRKHFPTTNVGLWVRLDQTDVSGVSDGYQLFPFYELGGSEYRDDGGSISPTEPSPVPGQPFSWTIKPGVKVLGTVAVTILPSDGSDHKPSAPFRVPAGQTSIANPPTTFELMVCGKSSDPAYNH